MDIKPNTFVINGVLVFGANTLQVSHVGDVPPDRQEVLAHASMVKVRIAESVRREAVAGLREIKARVDTNEPGLGDMGPNPDECGALADELDTLFKLKTRLDSLKLYIDARRKLCLVRGDKLLRSANDEATRRTERGILQADSYLSVRKYCDAHGDAVAAGRERAARVRAAIPAAAAATATPAANDAAPVERTGTDR